MKTLIATTLAALSMGTVAAPAPGNPADHASAGHPSAAAATTDGEVRKIDKAQGKLTLKHGPLTQLDMPGMTMVFKVADPKMLDALHEGDKVRFVAERVDGALTVTAIEPSN